MFSNILILCLFISITFYFILRLLHVLLSSLECLFAIVSWLLLVLCWISCNQLFLLLRSLKIAVVMQEESRKDSGIKRYLKLESDMFKKMSKCITDTYCLVNRSGLPSPKHLEWAAMFGLKGLPIWQLRKRGSRGLSFPVSTLTPALCSRWLLIALAPTDLYFPYWRSLSDTVHFMQRVNTILTTFRPPSPMLALHCSHFLHFLLELVMPSKIKTWFVNKVIPTVLACDVTITDNM